MFLSIVLKSPFPYLQKTIKTESVYVQTMVLVFGKQGLITTVYNKNTVSNNIPSRTEGSTWYQPWAVLPSCPVGWLSDWPVCPAAGAHKSSPSCPRATPLSSDPCPSYTAQRGAGQSSRLGQTSRAETDISSTWSYNCTNRRRGYVPKCILVNNKSPHDNSFMFIDAFHTTIVG